MTKILVTGGVGLIGSHTVHEFLQAGDEVYVYDFFQQYIWPTPATFLENVQYRFDQLLKGAHVLRGGTQDKDHFRRYLNEVRPNYVVHLASLPLINQAIEHTGEAFESIVHGTVNILEVLCDMPEIPRFVYVSSSMVYGDFEKLPMPEDGRKAPKEIYGSMKLASEILVKGYSACYGIPYVIVRPSSVYGPTDNNRRVLQIFVEHAIQGKPITAVNPSSPDFDFSYVADVAYGLRLLTLSPNTVNQEFNLTFGQGRSLIEAINILRDLFPDLCLQVTERPGEETFRPKRGALDISKAKQLAGYQPRYSLEAGLRKYVDFVRTYNRSLATPRV
jgi:nucleoside-diphosphate-sugar epimerase